MKKQKILLFGGSGFLGSRLLKELKPNTIIAPTHSELDLLNIKNVFKKIEEFQPDIIIYASGVTKIDAAESQKELAFSLNVKNPEQIAKYIAQQNIPFIYISTDAVFDGYTKKYVFRETDKPQPKSTYGISKLQGENAILACSTNNTVIRLITLFGIDYERPNFLTKALVDLQNNKQLFGIVDQVQNPLCVDIAAKGISFILNNHLSGIYHLGSLDWDTNYNFLITLAKTFGYDNSLINKISFSEFMKNKTGYRKKKNVLITDKFNQLSQNKILKTLEDSINNLRSSLNTS